MFHAVDCLSIRLESKPPPESQNDMKSNGLKLEVRRNKVASECRSLCIETNRKAKNDSGHLRLEVLTKKMAREWRANDLPHRDWEPELI
jgi:hypothetical protein